MAKSLETVVDEVHFIANLSIELLKAVMRGEYDLLYQNSIRKYEDDLEH